MSTGRAGTVCVVDTEAGKVTRVLAVGKRPWGIGMSPDGKSLYVADGPSNEVAVVDLDAPEVTGRIGTGVGPWGIAIVPGRSVTRQR